MAQLLANLNDKGKDLEGGSSEPELGHQEVNRRRKVQKGVQDRYESRDYITLSRLPKVDLPTFTGENPREWIRKANKYFKINGVEEEMKSEVAELYFRDKADIWFHGVFNGRDAIPWEELCNALCKRFGDGFPEEAIEEFNKLMQTGTVADYLEQFEMLKALVMPSFPHLQDCYYKTYFLSGLKEEIVTMVKMAKPKTLADAIEVAKLQERNLRALQKIHKTTSYSSNFQKPLLKTPNYSKSPDKSPSYPKFFDKPIPKTHNNYTNTQNQFKRLTPAELNLRREKGLCFKFTEPYTIGHVCRQSHLNLLIMEEEGMATTEVEGEKKDENDVFCDCIGGELENEHMEVSIHALAGGSEHKTIRIKGMIKGKAIVALVKSGSTHCFIDEQGYEFQHQFNTLRLGGCDMILGVDWLARYNPMEFDFRGLSMKFRKEKQQVSAVVDKEPDQEPTPPEMEKLLQEFKDVFQEPQGLPPERSQDHCITLKEGAKPFQIRPYRCPYIQKTEIEKLVQEMLQTGIIQLSSSPFASPVLLVKKKDGSWRFCVDYRQLNELTVKNKFPISLIDELLDELHGSKYFTKIDLRAGYFQIRVRKEDIPKTAFRTHQGLYKFKVMPFELTNAPATFQGLMNQVFQKQLRKRVLVFFDDILIYSPTLVEHVKHVTEVLGIMRQH
ncbi:uncharacterized protein LOC113769164 [Coffea eugenioides]|uniref:uncharacterized protein LOC113769164 n=1 Tax=Coffea eugenioides TaxID=49369 RepID=UPI000F6094DD|nr:uncharacterized protein LOC113769164 [Coffea eugenioides]